MTHTLYACAGSGNCYKPWLLAQQTGQALDVQLIDVLSGEQKTPAYLEVNPLGVVPYLETSTGDGIGESNAMLWYLAEDTRLMPSTRSGRAQALQWMFFEQSRLEPYISPARFFTTILPTAAEERATDIQNWRAGAEPGLMRLDGHLSISDFMLQEGYSIADISLFGYVHVLEEAGLSLAEYPAIAEWIGRVSATKGFVPLSQLHLTDTRLAAV